MNISYETKCKEITNFFLILFFFVIYFVPFPNSSYNVEGKFQYCKYRLAVYEFNYIEADGEGYGNSDTFFYDISLGKKIGGTLEYFGLKKIDKK